MAFTWVNYDESFLKEILEKSELDSQQRADLHDALKNNDKDVLISIMCSICSEPDISFVKQYRTIIEKSFRSAKHFTLPAEHSTKSGRH